MFKFKIIFQFPDIFLIDLRSLETVHTNRQQQQDLLGPQYPLLEQPQPQQQQQPQQQTHQQLDSEQSDMTCCICLDPNHKKNVVFVPCGHLHTCLRCALLIQEQSRCQFHQHLMSSFFISKSVLNTAFSTYSFVLLFFAKDYLCKSCL